MQNLYPLTRVILAELTPDPERVQMAKVRGQRLIADLDRLAVRFSVRRVRPFGSVYRGTALAGFKDIDYLVPVHAEPLATLSGDERSPGRTLGELAAELERCRAGLSALGYANVRIQSHSVGVEYPRSGLRIDIVPAMVTRGRGADIYRIPSRPRGCWIKTRVDYIENLAATAPPKVLDAIRLLKGWKRARGRNRGFTLPSYAVELMLFGQPAVPHTCPPLVLVEEFLRRLADADARRRLPLDGHPTNDPVAFRDGWKGENLLEGNTAAARRKLIDAARRAIKSLEKARRAPTELGALGIMRRLFIGRHG